METRGQNTLNEILSQTRAWQEALEIVGEQQGLLEPLRNGNQAFQFVFTGCGSIYYLSLAAAAHLRALTRWQTLAVPASELWLDPETYFHPGDRLIAASRSGTTTETLRAVDAFRTITTSPVVTVQCVPDAPLGRRGTANLLIPSGAEKSTAETRSFSSIFLAISALNAIWAKRQDLQAALLCLPMIGEGLLGAAETLAREWGPRLDIDRIYFLGSGTRYGLASEASLKMKEMSLTDAEPFHFLEFRHGPKSMVTDRVLVVGLVSESAQAEERQVLRETAGLGAHVLALGEQVEPIGRGAALSFASGLPEAARDVLYMPPLQLLAFERARAKGLDPDQPRNLEAVVVLP